MKKTELKETTYCDHCGKEGYVTSCIKCETEHCWECRKLHGKEYNHGVFVCGSGDGYYCNKCDAELTRTGLDKMHAAYRVIALLAQESRDWNKEFDLRVKAAEDALLSAQRRTRCVNS